MDVPRCQIQYDFAGDSGREKRELPFVIGVLTDISASSQDAARRFPERQFRDARESDHWPQGLRYLYYRVRDFPRVKVRILHASKSDLAKDLERAVSADQSYLFKRVHDDIYGVRGIAPFTVLVGDYEFSHDARDVSLLEGIAKVAATINAPFLAGASPAIFGREHFNELSLSLTDYRRLLDNDWSSEFSEFRHTEAAKYVTLALPPFRNPLEPEWTNAAWVMAVRMAQSFHDHGWCANICGEKSNLEAGIETEVDLISDDAEKILGDHGFAFLCGTQRRGAYFISAPSLAFPRQLHSTTADAITRMHCQLPYIMGAARFMHYAKVIMRDWRGPRLTGLEWQHVLNEWLMEYIGTKEGVEEFAAQPLREGIFHVDEDSKLPGAFTVVGFLGPRFLLQPCPVAVRASFPIML